MALPLPGASLTVNENALGIVPTPSTDIVVFLGVCQDGPSSTNSLASDYISKPVPFSAISDLVPARKLGPVVKASAYHMSKTGASIVFIRLPKTARAATVSAVDESGMTDQTVNPTVTGTANNQYSVKVLFTLGGVTGTGPITYTYSLDGGTTYSAPISLAAGLTIGTAFTAATGLTVTLATGKTITTNDYFTFTTTAASASVQPVVSTVDGATTSVVTVTGTPEDAYEGLLEVITGGTVGTTGIVVRYSLDGGRSYTPPLNLLTAVTLQINEYTIQKVAYDTGLDFAFAAGDLTAGDSFSFTTTAPEALDSDVVAGLEALKTSGLDWSFTHIVGTSNATTAGTVQSKLDELANRAAYTWSALSARARGPNEPDATWRAALLADVSALAASRISIGAGLRRITCAVSAMRLRRPAMWVVIPRVAKRPIEEDPARVKTGALPADVEVYGENQQIVEHDARINSDLHGARYVTLTTSEEEAGLFVTRGNMMAREGTDVSRIPLRRVLDLGSLIFRRVMRRQLEEKIFVNGPTFPTVARRGCIREVDARKIEREIRTALEAELTSQGRASAVTVAVSRTDPLLTNGGKITAKVRIVPLAYIDQFEGDISYENPALADLTEA